MNTSNGHSEQLNMIQNSTGNQFRNYSQFGTKKNFFDASINEN